MQSRTAFALGTDGGIYVLVPAANKWELLVEVGTNYRSIAVDCGYLYGVNEDLGVDVQSLKGARPDGWKQLARGYVVSIAVCGGTVFGVGQGPGGCGHAYCFSRTGRTKRSPWELSASGRCRVLASADDRLYALGADSWIYWQPLQGLSTDTRWSRFRPPCDENQDSLAVLGNDHFLGTSNGMVWQNNGSQSGWSLCPATGLPSGVVAVTAASGDPCLFLEPIRRAVVTVDKKCPADATTSHPAAVLEKADLEHLVASLQGLPTPVTNKACQPVTAPPPPCPQTPPRHTPAAEEEEEFLACLRPGWEDQGVELRDRALWCRWCDKGPITMTEVMVRHLESRTHVRKVQQMSADSEVPAPVPREMELRGISFGNSDHPRVLPREYLCTLCDAGPFQTLEAAKMHLKGARHVKRERHDAAQNCAPDVLEPELEAAGIEACEQYGLYRCNICDVGPFDVQTATQHTLGKAHKKNGGAPVAGAVSVDIPPASGGEKQHYLPSELELLPGYVDAWNGSLWCSLCTSKAATLQSMVHHLCGDKHSKACRKSGRPELVFVETRQCFEEFETGRAVRREDDDFDEFIPPAQKNGSVGRLHAPMDMSIERKPLREREPAQPEDEPLVDVEPVANITPKDAATAQAWANWSGRARTPGRRSREQPQQSSRTRSVSWGPEVRPLEAEVKTHGEGEGTVVLVDITGTPPGWTWDPSTCLSVSKGEQVEVLHAEDEWVYARCRGLDGWLPSSSIGPAQRLEQHDTNAPKTYGPVQRPEQRCSDAINQTAASAETGATAAAAAAAATAAAEAAPLVQPPRQAECFNFIGKEMHCLFKSGIPATWEWDTSTVMHVDGGDVVRVLAVDGNWVYGRSGQREGWLPKSVVGLGEGPAV
mmetsp:Transcript_985/g.1860  ORF Transcript_985/g.1860 Transcript_985/m.1860 type:complete len:880 (-) Transcript_985:77-2716(-)